MPSNRKNIGKVERFRHVGSTYPTMIAHSIAVAYSTRTPTALHVYKGQKTGRVEYQTAAIQ